MNNILTQMNKRRSKLRSKKLENDVDLIKTMYKIYPEDAIVPSWLKKGMCRIHHDENFQNFARVWFSQIGTQ